MITSGQGQAGERPLLSEDEIWRVFAAADTPQAFHAAWLALLGRRIPNLGVALLLVAREDGSYAPIDPAATYTVASNDFMRRGGDGYTVFNDNAIDPYDFGKPLDQVMADYIANNSPIAPAVEGRITRVDA